VKLKREIEIEIEKEGRFHYQQKFEGMLVVQLVNSWSTLSL
jgi:hypothetical protein